MAKFFAHRLFRRHSNSAYKLWAATEPLEQRLLFSITLPASLSILVATPSDVERAAPTAVTDTSVTSTAGLSSPATDALTPSQIASFYGFNSVSFSGSSGPVTGDGTGQTIAIIDWGNDAEIVNDLEKFDSQYSLSGTSGAYASLSQRLRPRWDAGYIRQHNVISE